MRIVLSSYDFPPGGGGVATYVARLASALSSAGHEVTVVTTSQGLEDGYPYTVIRQCGPLGLLRLYAGADMVLLSNLSIRLGWPLLLTLGTRYVLFHHSESAFRASRSWSPQQLLRRTVMKRSVLHCMASDYLGRQSGLARHLVVCPFPGDRPLPRPPLSERRAELLVAGRLEPEKGIGFVLDNVELICRLLDVSRIRIAGAGSMTDVVQQRAQERNSRIVYLGRLSAEHTKAEMASNIYTLVPSLWNEPFGTVALEALSAGAIVIATRRGGIPEALGSLGMLYEPDHLASFERALREARLFFGRCCTNPQMAAAYLDHVDLHAERFRPERAVESLMGAWQRIAVPLLPTRTQARER